MGLCLVENEKSHELLHTWRILFRLESSLCMREVVGTYIYTAINGNEQKGIIRYSTAIKGAPRERKVVLHPLYGDYGVKNAVGFRNFQPLIIIPDVMSTFYKGRFIVE